jgi:hypothetical protein
MKVIVGDMNEIIESVGDTPVIRYVTATVPLDREQTRGAKLLKVTAVIKDVLYEYHESHPYVSASDLEEKAADEKIAAQVKQLLASAKAKGRGVHLGEYVE